MRTCRLAICIVIFSVACGAEAVAAANAPETAARTFLAQIDRGGYDASWNAASGWLRNNVTATEWAAHAGQYRKPLGTIAKRTMLSVEFEEDLEDMPDGRYAFVTFDTMSGTGGRATELVGLVLGDDAVWRVIGYQAH